MGDSEGEVKKGYTFLNIHPENFALGAAWGIISGYTSQDFFRPVPDKWRVVKFVASYMSKTSIIKHLARRNILYPSMVTGRIITRAVLAGSVFDVAERKYAQYLNSGKSTTSSTLAGLTVLSVFFRVQNSIRDSALASVGIIGGYALGTQLARFVVNRKRSRDGSGKTDD